MTGPLRDYTRGPRAVAAVRRWYRSPASTLLICGDPSEAASRAVAGVVVPLCAPEAGGALWLHSHDPLGGWVDDELVARARTVALLAVDQIGGSLDRITLDHLIGALSDRHAHRRRTLLVTPHEDEAVLCNWLVSCRCDHARMVYDLLRSDDAVIVSLEDFAQ